MPTLSERAAGALLGLAAGRAIAHLVEADGGLALTLVLAEELAQGRRDLRALAQRWIERAQLDPRGIDPETAAALAHLARHDSPPAHAAGRGSDPLVRVVPVALACHDAPRTLVSATYHIAALTHPDPLVAWAAVAVNVALGCLLQGRRDFVPAVVEVLRGNDVPPVLLAAVRRIPLPLLTGLAPETPAALVDADAALRLAYHEPLLGRGLATLAGAGPSAVGRAGLAGALLGARDGRAAIAAAWPAAIDRDDVAHLAARLVARTPAGA